MPLWAQHAVETFGYAAIFLLIAVEGVGVPLPGETALLVGGAFAGAGQLDIRMVIAVAALAAIVGDSSGYLLGRRWGRQVIDRWGHRVGLTPARVVVVERFFERYGVLAVFFGRYQALFRTYIGLFAGMARMPFGTFLLFRAASCIVWALIFGLVSYYLGERWTVVQGLVHTFGVASAVAGGAAVVIAALVYLLRRSHAEKVAP